MLDRADHKLAKLSKGLLDLPSLPLAVERLVQLSEKEPTPRQLADLIGADQGLTAKVLRLVNSAFYSLRSPIASLSHASSLLGTKTLKSMALSVSVMNLFQDPDGSDPRAFWRHSVAAAIVAQKTGRVLLPQVEEDLYVAGLLHDAGVAILMENLQEDYAALLVQARSTSRDLSDLEAEMFGTTHAEVGHVLASRWRLPPLVCECIRLHEEPDDAIRVAAPGDLEKAVDIIRFADRWATRAGFDFIHPGRNFTHPVLPLPAWAGIDVDDLRPTLDKLPREVADRESLLFPA